MSNAILKISAAVLIIASAAGWWFGAYLPFQKSKRFIEVIRSGSVIKTIDELERRFNAVLDFYSPVGEAEAIGFFADQMVNVLGTKPPAENPESPELTKVFLKVASLNEVGWIIYQKEEYFRRAENYLLEGLKISPNRPQYLYGLFNLYASVGDRERVKAIGEEILRFWPNDEVMRAKVSLL